MGRSIGNQVVLVSLIGLCTLAGAESPDRLERMVSVQGHAKVSAPPDIARLRVQVSEEGPGLDPVNAQARQKMEQILKALKSQGIAEKDIQTESFQVGPKTEWKNGRSDRVGFIVSNQVGVVVRDLKKTGAVLNAVLDAGANNISGPDFVIEHPQPLERKALEMAVEDAKAKAVVLAQAAGASLGSVISLQEGATFQPGPRPMMMRSEAKLAASAEVPIATGEDTVQATVSASFSLK
jgi:uncharacterized protein YggE